MHPYSLYSASSALLHSDSVFLMVIQPYCIHPYSLNSAYSVLLHSDFLMVIQPYCIHPYSLNSAYSVLLHSDFLMVIQPYCIHPYSLNSACQFYCTQTSSWSFNPIASTHTALTVLVSFIALRLPHGHSTLLHPPIQP